MACITEASSGFPNANGHIPLRVRDDPGGAWRARLEHLHGRQVAPVRRGREEPGLDASRSGRSGAASSASTGSWAPRRTSGTPTSSTTTIRSTSRRRRRRATTSRSTSPTRRCRSSGTPRRSLRTSRSSSTTRSAPATRRTTCRRSGRTSTRASSTWATRPTASSSSPTRRSWGSSREHAELSPINPYTDLKGPHGQEWPALDVVRPWDSLTDDEKKLFARMAEVYAGFVSHADDQLGRMLDYLEESGQLDNTLIVLVSDNGASGEGGPNGSVNENKFFNGMPDTIEENLKYARRARQPADLQPLPDRLGVGLQHAVQDVEALRQLPGRHGRPDDRLLAGPDQDSRASARQYTHAIDIVPTIYDCLGVELPEVVHGLHADPARGRELRGEPARRRRPRASRRSSTRCSAPARIYHEGWKAASVTPAAPDALGRLRDAALGAVQHRDRPERVPRPRRAAPGQAGRSWSRSGGRRRASTAPCRSSRATRSAILARASGRSSPSRATVRLLPGLRGGARVGRGEHPQPLVRASRSRSRSTRRTRRASCSRRARGSAATRSTSRTASSSTSTTGSASSSRSSSPTQAGPDRRLRALGLASRRRATGCRPRARSASTSTRRRSARARSRPSPASSRSPAKGSTSARTAPSRSPTTTPAASPWAFIGGTIHQVVVDVSGDPWVDLEKEVVAAFARD